jgi:hypothetical protein
MAIPHLMRELKNRKSAERYPGSKPGLSALFLFSISGSALTAGKNGWSLRRRFRNGK